MKRRNLLVGSAALIATAPAGKINLAWAAGTPDPNRLNQDLTPFGAERAASASGHIPEWTGGVTAAPAGWTPGMIPADLFSDEQPLFTITAANVAQYSDLLCEGQKQMFKQYGAAGWKMNVYKTHRTSAFPQTAYDGMFKNVTRVQPVAEGIINGFTGAAGGAPFPILSDDPAVAGAQIMWNHDARWQGVYSHAVTSAYVVGNGQKIVTAVNDEYIYTKLFDPNVSFDEIDHGYFQLFYIYYTAPANQLGGKFQTAYSFQPLKYPNTAYEYLIGEGRIREAPQAQYDIPVSSEGDAINYDETAGFNGSLDRYTWKLVGKKEIIISYNNHALIAAEPEDILGEQFIDPDKTRWEIHRCWVVEAKLAPGKRMSEPFRRFYVDEDTWCVAMADNYDEQGNLWKYDMNHFNCVPNLPGVRGSDQNTVYNFQSQEYVINCISWAKLAGGVNFDQVPLSKFSPQDMANSGGL